jgi:ATP-dependent Clp protease ATP-binding subunit ClpA
VFDQFTDRARKVVFISRDEAKRLKHEAVRPEHLLLAIIEEGKSRAAQALKAHGLAKQTVSSSIKGTSGQDAFEEDFTEDAWATLQEAMAEARLHDHSFVSPEHILIALFATEHGATEILDEMLEVRTDLLQSITDPQGLKEGKICSRCGASAVSSGKVEELSIEVEDKGNINLLAYYCGECRSTFGLVKGEPH